MKSCGGRRDGTWTSSVDGLISLPVQVGLRPNSSDVMGQWQFSKRLELVVELTWMMELQPKATAAEVADHSGRHVLTEPNLAANRRFFCRIDDGNPQGAFVRKALRQQHFYFTTAFLGAMKPCGKHLRIVEHK